LSSRGRAAGLGTDPIGSCNALAKMTTVLK
jgi:hypothetical protein